MTHRCGYWYKKKYCRNRIADVGYCYLHRGSSNVFIESHELQFGDQDIDRLESNLVKLDNELAGINNKIEESRRIEMSTTSNRGATSSVTRESTSNEGRGATSSVTRESTSSRGSTSSVTRGSTLTDGRGATSAGGATSRSASSSESISERTSSTRINSTRTSLYSNIPSEDVVEHECALLCDGTVKETELTLCGHPICKWCLMRLNKKECPICKRLLRGVLVTDDVNISICNRIRIESRRVDIQNTISAILIGRNYEDC